MDSFIKPRLFSAASFTACGVSPRLTQFLTISSAWIGCSSSYLACSSSHQRPRGPIFDADVVAEEGLAVLGGAVEQQLEPLGKVPDDRVERHQKVLNLPVDQLVLGGVHDHFCVEDRLTARVESGIQVGHPAWVGGHLHRHWISFQGANEKIDDRPAGGKCTTSP